MEGNWEQTGREGVKPEAGGVVMIDLVVDGMSLGKNCGRAICDQPSSPLDRGGGGRVWVGR